MTSLAIASPNDDDPTPVEDLLITDFGAGLSDLGWYVVNDGVMGGLSEGGFELRPGELLFTGKTNTNGGGFSSIRTMPVALNLSDFEGIRLKILGDGRRYTWQLTTNAMWRGRPVSFWAEFDTRDKEWDIIDIPFSRFEPRFRGRVLDGPALDPGRITGLGLMINDGKDGAFAASLASVGAYATQVPSSR